jgi:hypothetical protein
MNNLRVAPTEPVYQSEDALLYMSQVEFIAAWAAMVGEPPAIMLESRSEMIQVLVESVPIIPFVVSVTSFEGDGNGHKRRGRLRS